MNKYCVKIYDIREQKLIETYYFSWFDNAYKKYLTCLNSFFCTAEIYVWDRDFKLYVKFDVDAYRKGDNIMKISEVNFNLTVEPLLTVNIDGIGYVAYIITDYSILIVAADDTKIRILMNCESAAQVTRAQVIRAIVGYMYDE